MDRMGRTGDLKILSDTELWNKIYEILDTSNEQFTGRAVHLLIAYEAEQDRRWAERRRKYEEEGETAFAKGRPAGACPYPTQLEYIPIVRAWTAGWNRALMNSPAVMSIP